MCENILRIVKNSRGKPHLRKNEIMQYHLLCVGYKRVSLSVGEIRQTHNEIT